MCASRGQGSTRCEYMRSAPVLEVRSPRGGVVAWRRVEKTGYTLFKQIDELGAGVMKFVDFYRYLRTQRAPPPRLPPRPSLARRPD